MKKYIFFLLLMMFFNMREGYALREVYKFNYNPSYKEEFKEMMVGICLSSVTCIAVSNEGIEETINNETNRPELIIEKFENDSLYNGFAYFYVKNWHTDISTKEIVSYLQDIKCRENNCYNAVDNYCQKNLNEEKICQAIKKGTENQEGSLPLTCPFFLNVRGEDKLYKKIQFRLELDVSQNRFIFPRDPNNEYIVDDVSNQVSAYGNTFNFYSKGTDGSSFAGLYMKEVSTSKKCPVTTFCLDTQGSKYVWYAELGDSEKCDEKYDSRVSQTIDEFGANSGLVLKTEETDYGSKLIDRNNMLSILSCEELLGGDSEDDEIIGMLKALVLMLRIAVPILMIVLGALDFVKAIFADDESQMKKAQGKFVKRLILGVCIFLIPSFLKLLLTIANGIWGNIDTDFCGIL